MSLRVIAKRVALDPYRTRYLWVELGLFGLFFGLMTHLSSGFERSLGSHLVATSYIFVVLLAIGLSYDQIAKRRQNGSLRAMLAYPHSRRDIVLGTAIGRGLVTCGDITFGFLVAVAVSVLESGTLPVGGPLLYSWLTVMLIGATMNGLISGISAGTRTTNQAGLISFTSLILFFGLWGFIPKGIRYLLNGSWPTPPAPDWEIVFTWLNPFQAYQAVSGGLLQSNQAVSGFYSTEWFGVLVLLVWLLGPLLVGYRQFERSDL